MSLFSKFIKKPECSINVDDNAIVAVCSGTIIPNKDIPDSTFADNLIGKTIGIEPTGNEICSPINGKIEMIANGGHAFGIKANNGTGILVHIGIDTVKMHGSCFKILKKQGDYVKAGEAIIKADFDVIKKASYPCTTMIIIAEPVDNITYNFISPCVVKKGQIISG